ncbi:MAG TPA: heparinase II/III family protein, partial [Opitutaceae bacterium]
PYLDARERSTIRDALVNNALSFAPTAYGSNPGRDPRLFWVKIPTNWNQVCNGGMLTAALALADEEPELTRMVVGGVRKSLPVAMVTYQPDGAYPEGPSYWAYGTTFTVILLAELEECVGTDFGLGNTPAFDRTAVYRLAVQGPTGLAFNYADGEAALDESDDRGLAPYCWLAERHHSIAAIEHCRELIGQESARRGVNNDRFLALDAVWYPQAPSDRGKAEPLDIHFRGRADIALFRSAWGDPRALFVGFKAGDNATNHAQLGLGSFVLDADGVRWALNLGRDNYNLPGYFGAQRWSYFRLNNHSQNTLTPGDRVQEVKAVAPIITFGSTPNRAYAAADLTAAYPGEADRMIRGIEVLDRSRVLVEDELTRAISGVPLHWAMLTSASISLSANGRSALLTQEHRQLRVDALTPADARFRVGSTKPPTAAENQNEGTAMLVLDVPAPASVSDLRIGVLLTPVGDRWPALPPPAPERLSDWR